MTNQEIAKILYEMAGFYEMNDVQFKPRAYEKAAQGVESFDEPITDLYKKKGIKGLKKIPGVGQGIAEHIEELLRTGRVAKHEALKKKMPVDLSGLTAISGIGPKTVKTLYQELGIRNLGDLRKAAKSRKIRQLPGFGQKSEEQILEGLKFTESNKRFSLGQVYPIVEEIVQTLKSSKLFERLEVCGSYRRRQETIGDIDILATAGNSLKAMDFFVGLPGAQKVLEHGETKSEIRAKSGLQIDLRIVPRASWGAALQYFTGDKSHNVKLRKIAIERGLKLSEYGLFKIKKLGSTHPLSQSLPTGGGGKVGGETEEQVYNALGMDFIPPEMRTDSGEIEAAQKHQLPKLIDYGDVKGDLQVQTNWTDGSNSIEEMAEAAMKLGREYIAITDHTKSLAMTGGLDEKKLFQQGREIDRLNLKFKSLTLNPSPSGRGEGVRGKFWILKGAEVEILKDGSLDINDSTLARLDIVGVAVHSNFKMAKADMTKRIIRALSNSKVDIFFHPTTRIINKRPPIEFDFEEILKVCKKNKVALEINAHPDRLDLHDTLIRQAVRAGVKLVIDTDAHHTSHLGFMHFGEAQARRGWATKSDVLNTKSVQDLLDYFARKK